MLLSAQIAPLETKIAPKIWGNHKIVPIEDHWVSVKLGLWQGF